MKQEKEKTKKDKKKPSTLFPMWEVTASFSGFGSSASQEDERGQQKIATTLTSFHLHSTHDLKKNDIYKPAFSLPEYNNGYHRSWNVCDPQTNKYLTL